MTAKVYETARDEVIAQLSGEKGRSRLPEAVALLDDLVLKDFEDFLTVPGAGLLDSGGDSVEEGR